MGNVTVYVWQRIATPHMAHLAEALAIAGWNVVYVANESMSMDRKRMGWTTPALNRTVLKIAVSAHEVTEFALSAPANSIHICQGLRSNGLVGVAQKIIASRGLQHWAVLETVDDAGPTGWIKRVVYRWLLWRWRNHLQGLLAIGWHTPDWLVSRGARRDAVFPFAYFLQEAKVPLTRKRTEKPLFRFLFVGQLIPRKRVDQLLQALARLTDRPFELVVVGDGPMRADWEAQANDLLPNQVRWLGCLPMADIPQQMANADCMVLPSRHDGWGAVVSEALMVGTPVVCSDACGSAGVVRASAHGGIFSAGDVDELTKALGEVLNSGPLPAKEREALAQWADCLGVTAGAQYLSAVLTFGGDEQARPVPTSWQRVTQKPNMATE